MIVMRLRSATIYLTDSCAASIIGSCISVYILARALKPPGRLYIKQSATNVTMPPHRPKLHPYSSPLCLRAVCPVSALAPSWLLGSSPSPWPVASVQGYEGCVSTQDYAAKIDPMRTVSLSLSLSLSLSHTHTHTHTLVTSISC